MFNKKQKMRNRYPYTNQRMFKIAMKSIITIVMAAVFLGCGIAQIKSSAEQIASGIQQAKIEKELFNRELMIIGKDSHSTYEPKHTQEKFEADVWKTNFPGKTR